MIICVTSIKRKKPCSVVAQNMTCRLVRYTFGVVLVLKRNIRELIKRSTQGNSEENTNLPQEIIEIKCGLIYLDDSLTM